MLLRIMLLIFVIHASIIAQRVKIEKVHNTNLFELEDGTLITMAGVEIPSTNHPNAALSELAQEILDYEKINFTIGRIIVEYTCIANSQNEFKPVYISNRYLINTIDFNKLFLERGYAIFTNDVDSLHFQEYKNAELDARQSRKGIWQFPEEMISGHLDYCNSPADSCYTIDYKAKRIFRYDKSLGRITAEVILAPVIGILSGFAFAGLGSAVFTAHGKEAWGVAILGLYTGYCIGTAGGVYVIAEGGNKDLQFGWTIGAGLLGGLAAIALSDDDQWHSDNGYIPLLAGPLLTSVIYANAVAPYPSNEQLDDEGVLLEQHIPISHFQIYNSTRLFNIEIARINF